MKWITIAEYVDVETGEIISKSHVERGEYLIHKKSYKTEINGQYGTKKYINECRVNGQQRIQF